jgi:glycosyltransferase involved in cell wall biosynthesis
MGASSLRKPRLLWANAYCLLDTSSGASISVREMLLQLVGQGYEVHIVGATIFDHDRGAEESRPQWAPMINHPGSVAMLSDGPLLHHLLVTANTRRSLMTSFEEGSWHALYLQALDTFQPDLVFYYGGQTLDLLIAGEARARGIPSAFILANGNYSHTRWCRDVDLILTDSQATAEYYAYRLGIRPTAVGHFIDPVRVVAERHSRERILFINPVLEKGVAVVIRLAILLEQRRPDIVFEVVESRGNWSEMLMQVTTAMGQPREVLTNVVVTPNSSDMRPVYGRARLLLAPSLWWESGGLVVSEAMLNGIPAIVTDHGGMPEMVQDAGIILKLNAIYHEKPYALVPGDESLLPLLERMILLYDDASHYAEMVARAQRVGQTRHHVLTSTGRLLRALQPWVDLRAGDRDAGEALRRWHKHGLDDRPQVSRSGASESLQ